MSEGMVYTRIIHYRFQIVTSCIQDHFLWR